MKRISLVHCLMLVLPLQWAMAQLRSGDRVMIDEEVTDDLYVTGGTVTINAPVRGDLIVAGGTIIVNDSVTQDILVAGGSISLNGVVSDDIRCGGGTIELNGQVLGDFVVAGGRITIARNATIAGNLLSSGGEVSVEGNVKGNIRSASGTFVLNGIGEKMLDAKGGKIIINGRVQGKTVMAANVIELGTAAEFGDDVTYWNKSGTLDFKDSMQSGKASYDAGLEIENGKWHYLGFASFIMVLWYLGTALLMIFLIQYLFGLTLKNAANTVKNASLKSLWLGVLFLIGVPVVVVLFFITIIGIPIGILVLISYVTIILFATVVVALLVSNWINNTYYESSWSNGRVAFTAFGIFVVLKLASLTPFVGPLVMFLLACMTFGGILLNVKWKKNKALALT